MTRELVRVVAALVERDGTILVAQRTSPPAWAGWWEFPGGKVEAGETDAEALVRELDEELGIAVRVGTPLATAFRDEPARRIAISVYRAELIAGEPSARVHSALAWVTRQDVAAYRLLPEDRFVLEQL